MLYKVFTLFLQSHPRRSSYSPKAVVTGIDEKAFATMARC